MEGYRTHGMNPMLKMAHYSAQGMNPMLNTQQLRQIALTANPVLEMEGYRTQGMNPVLKMAH